MAFDLEDLKLAFRLHVARLVIEDDLVTTTNEAEWLADAFPLELLLERGFVDAAGVATDRFHDAAVAALDELPSRLGLEAKHALLADAWSAAVIDGELHVGEGSVVLMAARLLGLSDEQFDTFLAGRQHAAGVTAALLDED